MAGRKKKKASKYKWLVAVAEGAWRCAKTIWIIVQWIGNTISWAAAIAIVVLTAITAWHKAYPDKLPPTPIKFIVYWMDGWTSEQGVFSLPIECEASACLQIHRT